MSTTVGVLIMFATMIVILSFLALILWVDVLIAWCKRTPGWFSFLVRVITFPIYILGIALCIYGGVSGANMLRDWWHNGPKR